MSACSNIEPRPTEKTSGQSSEVKFWTDDDKGNSCEQESVNVSFLGAYKN